MMSSAATSGCSTPERGRDRGGRCEAKHHREPDPAGDLRGCARTAAEDAEDVESVGVLAAGPRRARAPGDGRRDEDAEQQQRDRPARERAAQRSPARARARARVRGSRRSRSRCRRPSRAVLRSAACGRRAQSELRSRSARAQARSRPSPCSNAPQHPDASSTRHNASAPIASRPRRPAPSRRKRLLQARSRPPKRPRALRSPRRRGHRAAAGSRRARRVPPIEPRNRAR